MTRMKTGRRRRILRRSTLDDMLAGRTRSSDDRPARPASKAQLIALRDMRLRELARVTARLAGIERRLAALGAIK